MQEIARRQDATLVAENQAMTFVFDQANFPDDVAGTRFKLFLQ
jgi:hypothetical protein